MTLQELVAGINASGQHKTLYHFTDEANFSGIQDHGLLSKERLRALNLWPPKATGGNDLVSSWIYSAGSIRTSACA